MYTLYKASTRASERRFTHCHKQSGWGRESSAVAIHSYMETKSVCMVI